MDVWDARQSGGSESLMLPWKNRLQAQCSFRRSGLGVGPPKAGDHRFEAAYLFYRARRPWREGRRPIFPSPADIERSAAAKCPRAGAKVICGRLRSTFGGTDIPGGQASHLILGPPLFQVSPCAYLVRWGGAWKAVPPPFVYWVPAIKNSPAPIAFHGGPDEFRARHPRSYIA
jgi:hypothetical protein